MLQREKTHGRILLLTLLLGSMLCLSSCGTIVTRHQEVLDTLPAYESAETHFSAGFQDYTDYCKYAFGEEALAAFANHSDFKRVTDKDVENIAGYFENFAGWVKTKPFADRYDFEIAQIKEGDYYYIYDKEGEPIGDSFFKKYYSYDVYYLDIERGILYYIHNNI